MIFKRLGYAIAAGLCVGGLSSMGASALALDNQGASLPGGSDRLGSPGIWEESGAIAQRVGTCRVTIAQIAVYEQPNAMSTVVSTIPEGGFMMLGSGRGEGWIQIIQPSIGWVDTSFLIGSDDTPCPPGFASYIPPAATLPPTDPAPSQGTVTPDDATAALSTGVVQCQVTPPDGLIVRNQPVISDRTYVATIASGLQTFELTDRVRTTLTPEGRRAWIYVLAPYEGWISTGFVGSESNLVGAGCP